LDYGFPSFERVRVYYDGAYTFVPAGASDVHLGLAASEDLLEEVTDEHLAVFPADGQQVPTILLFVENLACLYESGILPFDPADRGYRLERCQLCVAEWEDAQEPVELDWTPCNFRGERPWFLCLGLVNGVRCGRRVAILYGPGRYFLCRHCYDLVYESQRDDAMYRALHKAQSIRKRLGGSANMTEPFPQKPKECTGGPTSGSGGSTTRLRWSS
jgi:hypothetical protein